jgi:hypothetical protein
MQESIEEKRAALAPAHCGGWSYSQLAAWWNVSPRTVRRLVENETLEVFYVAGAPRVTDESRRRVEAARARPAVA